MKLHSADKPLEPMLEHAIRLRAYDLYVQRGRKDGFALDDWLEAEREILKESGRVISFVACGRVL